MTVYIVFFLYKNASLTDRTNRFTCIFCTEEVAVSTCCSKPDNSLYLYPIHIYI